MYPTTQMGWDCDLTCSQFVKLEHIEDILPTFHVDYSNSNEPEGFYLPFENSNNYFEFSKKTIIDPDVCVRYFTEEHLCIMYNFHNYKGVTLKDCASLALHAFMINHTCKTKLLHERFARIPNILFSGVDVEQNNFWIIFEFSEKNAIQMTQIKFENPKVLSFVLSKIVNMFIGLQNSSNFRSKLNDLHIGNVYLIEGKYVMIVSSYFLSAWKTRSCTFVSPFRISKNENFIEGTDILLLMYIVLLVFPEKNEFVRTIIDETGLSFNRIKPQELFPKMKWTYARKYEHITTVVFNLADVVSLRRLHSRLLCIFDQIIKYDEVHARNVLYLLLRKRSD